MRRLKIYIAGPITVGDTLAHIDQGMRVCNELLDRGFVPLCPHLTAFLHMIKQRTHDEWLAYDLEWLQECDAVLRLPGWSAGADAEVAMAMSLDIPVFYEMDHLLAWSRQVPSGTHWLISIRARACAMNCSTVVSSRSVSTKHVLP